MKFSGTLKIKGCGHLKGFNSEWKMRSVEETKAELLETNIMDCSDKMER
jgi:hypothetical protein